MRMKENEGQECLFPKRLPRETRLFRLRLQPVFRNTENGEIMRDRERDDI